jgi:stearoyl-CoA desaturase (delta-9 desaturase)
MTLSIGLFLAGYLLNMFTITVFYHRVVTHRAVTLSSGLFKFLTAAGPWLTGLDPKSWACVHRVHHLQSDQKGDPHSPIQVGVMGVWLAQYRSYLYYMQRMIRKDDEVLNQLMSDVSFDVSAVNRLGLSNLPYALHFLIGFLIAWFFRLPWAGAAYVAGIMSHPVQGWMVNALSHRYGYRNFETNDHSRNNLWVAAIAFGEGFQNNHHAQPQSAKFSKRFWEFDPGYGLCVIAK